MDVPPLWGHWRVRIVWRLEARPVGTFSLAGAQLKVLRPGVAVGCLRS